MVASLRPYLLSFIPVFVAVNSIGILPVFLSLTEGMDRSDRRRTIYTSVLTATVLALSFMFLGKWLLLFMGITIADFRVAGGLLLLVLSVNLLFPKEDEGGKLHKDVGAFPLGTPLITGPAVLTTVLVLSGTRGFAPTSVSLILNMCIVLLVFLKADLLSKVMGRTGMKAFSKVAHILLAAIAVTMMRKGIAEIIKTGLDR
jgi:multiple antibiotic resistance protein